MSVTSLFSSVKEYQVGQKVHSHKLLWQNLNKLFGQPNILLLIKTWLQFILRALFSFTLSCRAWWVNPLVHHCSETQRQEAKVKPTISDHKEGDGWRSQEGEVRRFYHQKKKKRGKTLEEKNHRHAPSANRFASDLLEGKILYCLGYMVNHTDEESVQCRWLLSQISTSGLKSTLVLFWGLLRLSQRAGMQPWCTTHQLQHSGMKLAPLSPALPAVKRESTSAFQAELTGLWQAPGWSHILSAWLTHLCL